MAKKIDGLKVGDRLQFIGESTVCFNKNAKRIIRRDHNGDLYVRCNHGKLFHFLYPPWKDSFIQIPKQKRNVLWTKVNKKHEDGNFWLVFSNVTGEVAVASWDECFGWVTKDTVVNPGEVLAIYSDVTHCRSLPKTPKVKI